VRSERFAAGPPVNHWQVVICESLTGEAQLYHASANVYHSLGDGYEADGKLELAAKNVQKAVEVGTKIDDPNLGAYKEHLKRLIAKANASVKPGGLAAH
jgi:hypothetical protein